MQKIILDMDTGVDDAMAIALALSSDRLDVLGITTTFGNVTTETAVENTLKVLSFLGRRDIPVFRGLDGTDGEVFQPSETVKKIHGDNGLGNVTFPESGLSAEKEDAVTYISRVIREYGKSLTIVTTGTLTNLAAVYRAYPELVRETGKVVIMGGALAVRGNVSEVSEANIHKNIADAAYVYSLDLDITQIGLDVTEQLALSSVDTQEWRTSEKGSLFADMVDFYIGYHEKGECFLHDPAAVAYLICPEAFTEEFFPVSVSDEGRTYMDIDNGRRICVPLHTDKSLAEKVIKDGISAALRPL